MNSIIIMDISLSLRGAVCLCVELSCWIDNKKKLWYTKWNILQCDTSNLQKLLFFAQQNQEIFFYSSTKIMLHPPKNRKIRLFSPKIFATLPPNVGWFGPPLTANHFSRSVVIHAKENSFSFVLSSISTWKRIFSRIDNVI